MSTDLKTDIENIPSKLVSMRKRSEDSYGPPKVVISGAWNIPGTLSWYELKGKGDKTKGEIERTNRELEIIGTKIEKDVERVTENIINTRWKVIVGGALGVDYFAAKKIYDMRKLDQLLIMFPSKKGAYLERLTKAYLDKDIISRNQLNENYDLLSKISKESPESIYEPRFENCEEEHYNIRNSREAFLGDYLCAFHVDNTNGTKDAIEKFIESKKFVYVYRYEVLKEGWTKEFKDYIYNIESTPLSEGEIKNIFGKDKSEIQK